jgi:hypothetical protein
MHVVESNGDVDSGIARPKRLFMSVRQYAQAEISNNYQISVVGRSACNAHQPGSCDRAIQR